MYVGCTRAKRRLHLVAVPATRLGASTQQPVWRNPPAQSALARLWPAVADRAEPAMPPPEAIPDGNAPPPAPALMRMPLAWRADEPPSALDVSRARASIAADAVPFDWAAATAAAIGTVAHRMLAQVARDGLAAWTPARIAASHAAVDVALAGEGVAAAERSAAVARVLQVLTRTLADKRGRWLFDTGHLDARSEWALAGVLDGAVLHVTLDRSFVADGVRWIIDFKTGRHDGGDPTAFLDREVERYRAPLERYARIMRGLDGRPIRLALYFPLVEGGWREWCCAAA